jgi:osmotically-inducible protein OsmY
MERLSRTLAPALIVGMVATVAVGPGPLSLLSVLRAAPAGAQTEPDNTAVNKRDRTADAPTAQRPSNTRSDLETSRQIRRAIVNDKDLFVYAHDVKVITRNGEVTLKGPVRTPEERASLQAKAAQVAGAEHVVDRLALVYWRTSAR